MSTMLEVLEKRLPDGLEIKKVKENNIEYSITFTLNGGEEKAYLPKTCTPGSSERVCDRAIASVMSTFAFVNKDYDEARRWLDKIFDMTKERSE